MVTHHFSSGGKLRKVFEKKYLRKSDFRVKNIKINSKVLYELLIRSYEWFKYFSQTWNLTISKNTYVNKRKSKHYEKLNYCRKKIDFRFKNIKTIESPNITSKVICELLIRIYERFKYFTQTWNLTISKNASKLPKI